jgi:hypothetical protein
VEFFDEISGSASKSTLDLGSIKFMTRGQPPSAMFWLACNAANLPPLQALQASDPAAYNRLVFLPARQNLQATTHPNFHAKVRRLAPAFVALLTTHLNQPLLPIPESMHEFKRLLTRGSTVGNFMQAHVAFVASWLQANTIVEPGRAIEATCLADSFVATHISYVQALHKYYNSRQVAAVETPLQLAGQLIDACVANLGVAMNQFGQYVGIGLQAAT